MRASTVILCQFRNSYIPPGRRYITRREYENNVSETSSENSMEYFLDSGRNQLPISLFSGSMRYSKSKKVENIFVEFARHLSSLITIYN